MHALGFMNRCRCAAGSAHASSSPRSPRRARVPCFLPLLLALAPLAAALPAPELLSDPSPLPRYTVRGHVYLAGTREPLEGFRVFLSRRWTQLGETRTNADGRFEFDLVRTAPCRARLVAVPDFDIYDAPSRSVVLPPGGGDVELTLYARSVFPATFVRNLTWEGRVFMWDAVTPLEGLALTLGRQGHTLGETRSDSRGFFRFALRDVPTGPYTLFVAAENDLLEDAALETSLGEHDAYRTDSIILSSPATVRLVRVTFLGRAEGHPAAAWAAAGALVRFVTGSHVLGTAAVGEGGYFHKEKVYAPPGPVVVEMIPRGGLLHPVRTLVAIPRQAAGVPAARVSVALRPTPRWWLLVLLGPALLLAAASAALRFWILPEWKAVRASMRAAPRAAESAAARRALTGKSRAPDGTASRTQR